jgi:chloramphenicol 3-O phosphotransferase
MGYVHHDELGESFIMKSTKRSQFDTRLVKKFTVFDIGGKCMNKGKIVLLNGVSSSGKSSLSKELVKLFPDYFHFSSDDYDTIIEKMEDRENGRLIPVPTEHFIHRSIAMFSDKGVNLVVDQILHDVDTLRDCIEVLGDYPVYVVGVLCHVDELERRELARGDRSIGQAKKQLDFVHQQNEVYDIAIDTYSTSIQEAAKAISLKILDMNNSVGWKATVENHKNKINVKGCR